MKTLSTLAAAALGTALLVCASLPATAAEDKGKAPTVSKEAAKPLKAANQDLKDKKYHEAIEELQKVEALPKRSPYETHLMNEMYRYSYSKLGDKAQAAKYAELEINDGFLTPQEQQQLVQGLAAENFNSHNYDKAIDYAKRAIQGGYGGETMQTVLSEAYYLKGDYSNSLKYTQQMVDAQIKNGEMPKQQPLELILSSCVKLQDNTCTTKSLERLVQYYPKPEYWQNLLFSMFNQKGTDDRTTLDIYRLANQVNAMKTPDQFTEMAELALDQGSPGEAQRVLEKGISQNVFTDQRTRDRAQRLLETAKKRAAADQAGLPKLAQDASQSKSGDAEVGLGLAYLSYQQYDKAVQAINDGLGKGGVKNEAQAHLLLGIAELKSGNKAEATKAWHQVKGDPTRERLANLWNLYAHQAQGESPASASR